MQNHPDIRFFDGPIGRPFARFDYMNQLPTLTACEGILAFFQSCRKNGLKLSKCHMDDEQRAYFAIKNHQYTTNNYKWMEK